MVRDVSLFTFIIFFDMLTLSKSNSYLFDENHELRLNHPLPSFSLLLLSSLSLIAKEPPLLPS